MRRSTQGDTVQRQRHPLHRIASLLVVVLSLCCCRTSAAVSSVRAYSKVRAGPVLGFAGPAFVSSLRAQSNRDRVKNNLSSSLCSLLQQVHVSAHTFSSAGTFQRGHHVGAARAVGGLGRGLSRDLRTALAVAPGSTSSTGRSVGIDLGTTNSAVAVIVDGKPVIIRSSQRLCICPCFCPF